MSTPGKERNDIHALAAEEQRLTETELILHDILMASLDVMERGDRRGWAGARTKRDHWDAVHQSVQVERDAASDAYSEARFGRTNMEQIRAIREAAQSEPGPRRGIERSR